MKISKIICVSLIYIILCLLFACTVKQATPNNIIGTSFKPNITQLGEGGIGYTYLVDNNTGVVYLKYFGGRSSAITVMLNTDGAPITIQQLEKMSDEK